MASDEEYRQVFGENRKKPKNPKKIKKPAKSKKSAKVEPVPEIISPPEFNYQQKKSFFDNKKEVSPGEARKAVRWLIGLAICFIILLLLSLIF